MSWDARFRNRVCFLQLGGGMGKDGDPKSNRDRLGLYVDSSVREPLPIPRLFGLPDCKVEKVVGSGA